MTNFIKGDINVQELSFKDIASIYCYLEDYRKSYPEISDGYIAISNIMKKLMVNIKYMEDNKLNIVKDSEIKKNIELAKDEFFNRGITLFSLHKLLNNSIFNCEVTYAFDK